MSDGDWRGAGHRARRQIPSRVEGFGVFGKCRSTPKPEGGARAFAALADVLAKALLDIKLILDIEKALADDSDFGNPRNSPPVQDQILTIIHEANAVCAARRVQARGRTVVKQPRATPGASDQSGSTA